MAAAGSRGGAGSAPKHPDKTIRKRRMRIYQGRYKNAWIPSRQSAFFRGDR